MFNVNGVDENNLSRSVNLDKLPDECSICHNKITPTYSGVFYNSTEYEKPRVQVVFRCPSKECRDVFIGFYLGGDPHAYYQYSKPFQPTTRNFSEIINSVSPSFILIYNQASTAEQLALTVICGAGYRKALEFLIKDYVIGMNPDKQEEIRKEFLGTTIESRVSHPQLKAVSKRAVWLGNDETHYERKWEDKDITDLKDLIELTIRWIETEKLTEKLLEDMPEKKTDEIQQNP